ncbi:MULTISPECIES: hypothetical protein [unclassified Vibrio]|uniref:hypothetical protein n=1 Tax=unclassified Vibrio TaxID=2614977 RepID=UPI0012A78884|nr:MULTISPECIES: hypothetical protein [unclassified Vibrio]QFT40078.1 hypothetical protein FIU99_27180 [Vibrio sp. THAF64]QGM38023.1 hypothetical protein GGC04_27385 [Vibrio sp. THAF191d]QGN73518.1 hypothetical protein GGC03_27395 [Vibrio sp. THAF191c]
MNALLSQLGKASPLGSLLMKMKGQLDSQADANRVYKDLYPVLQDLLERGYRFESPEIQGVVSVLRELPAWGAKRREFEKRYLRDEYTLRKLPRDPSYFNGQGCWH